MNILETAYPEREWEVQRPCDKNGTAVFKGQQEIHCVLSAVGKRENSRNYG